MKKGWQTKTLGEICDIERGGSPRPIQEFITTDPNGINWIKIGDATASGKYIYKTEEKIKPEGAKRSRMVYEGDFILSNSMSFGRPYIMKTEGCIHDGWLVLHKPKVDPDYLYFVLSSDLVFDQFNQLAAGSTVRNLNIGLAKSVEIPYPPLTEQQRIVGLLDEAFEGLATAKANAEKNLQNARALFESHLQSVFTQRGNGWVEKQLGDVCELFQGLCINAKTKHLLVEKSSLPLLRIKDLRSNSAEQFIAETGWPKNAYVSEDEIIYTRTGQIGLVFRGRVGVLHNNCFKVRPKPVLNSDYLFWWLQNPMFRARITTLASKTAQPDITHSLFKVQPIQIPPRDYQDKAIAVIDGMREETQRLARIYERKLSALAELKKSLLHQAFTGEL